MYNKRKYIWIRNELNMFAHYQFSFEFTASAEGLGDFSGVVSEDSQEWGGEGRKDGGRW